MTEHKQTVCIDLDGVLAHYDGWRGDMHIGEPNPQAVKLVHMLRDADVRVLIFTCRTNRAFKETHYGEVENAIREWLDDNGLGFCDLHTEGGKPFAGAYIDDRSVYFPENEGRALIAFEAAMRLLKVDPLRTVKDD